MKKLGILFIILMTFLMIPFSVLADKATDSNVDNESSEKEENVSDEEDNDEDEEEENMEVKVYFFHRDGCPHCADAEEFFDSIEDEYGHLFELVAYETWYDEDNAALLEEIAEVRDEEIGGVPYILIGNKSFPGYLSDFDDDIIDAIEEEYEVEVSKRYDIMDYLDIINDGEDKEETDNSNDVMALIIILITIGAIATGVIFARKKTV